MKRILLTGGHAATTGLAIIQKLKRSSNEIEIYWVGVKDGFEQKLYPNYGVKLYTITTGKIQTKFTKNTIPLILKIPASFIEAYKLIKKIKPDVILSFGGSVSFPVVFFGYLNRIPVIIHEQTAALGRANQFAAWFANIIAISRETSRKYLRKSKVILTGNPLIEEVQSYLNRKPKVDVKTILFTGGSRGSTWINNALLPILPELLERYRVIVQAGESNISQFSITHPNLTVFGLKSPSAMLELMSGSDIVISRAGANTISTLIILKKPSLLIPIPWSYMNEQQMNAEFLKNLGMARILNQNELTPSRLLAEIKRLIREYKGMVKNMENYTSPDLQASQNVIKILDKYI